MAFLTPVPDPNVLYLLQETAQRLQEEGNGGRDPAPSRPGDNCTASVSGGQNYAPALWNCSQISQHTTGQSSASLQSYNAMELLNLISIKCTSLLGLGGGQRGGPHVDDSRRNAELRRQEGGTDFGRETELHQGSPLTSNEVFLAPVNRTQDGKWGKTPEGENTVGSGSHNKGIVEQAVPEEYVTSPAGEVLRVVEKTPEGGSPVENGVPDGRICSGKTPRKQKTPSKSPEKVDPSFQGIRFQMHLGVEQERFGGCHLMVTSCYSRGKCRRVKRSLNSTSLSSSSEDDQTSAFAKGNKRCASCKTHKTPLWRDAEDGTPLCNACGIRYKKHGVRCCDCWNIPKKDGKSYSRFCDCGGTFGAQI